jgi:catechol 2,3-dioxygenase-like lactoylglutathione lyase family enzyme
MRSAVFFIAGAFVGAMLLGRGVAQGSRTTHALNHVGIVVANYDEAFEFYTRTMGFKEAYTIRRPDGSVQLTYLQLNRETFVELIPAGPGQQPGITHFGVEVGDLDAMVTQIRSNGGTIADPGLTPANALFARMTDREGVQIEVMQFGPEALQRKAMEAWR